MSWRKLLYLTAFVLALVSAGNWSGVCRADWPDNVGLLFGSQGIEPGDPSQGEAPPGNTNWYVDANAPDGGDGSYANPYNSFEQVCGYLDGGNYITGQIRGGDYLYVKGTFSASNHVEGSNNMDIHIGRGIQAGTAAEPTVIKSWLGSPRAVFDGEYIKNSLIQFRSTTTAGHFVIHNVEVKRAAGRGISVIENVAGCEVISVVIRDGHGDGIMGTGGAILFRLNEGQPHYIMRNSLVYNNDVNPEGGTNNRGGISILSEGTVQTGASIDIYDNEIYDEVHAIRHKHSGNVIFNAYHNIIHDSMSAFYVRIYNENNIHHNLIYDMSGTAFQLVAENQQGDRRSYIYNNTVYQAPALLSTGPDDAAGWRRIVDLRDNIYYDTITTGTSNPVITLGRWSMDDFDLSDWTSTNNDYYYLAGRTPFLIHHSDFISWSAAGAYLNDPVMYDFDPQFVDGPNHDFHLQGTSPAIGAASDNGDLGALGTGTPQPPGQASNPSPADTTTDVSANADLSWSAGSGATSRDVYFGTDSTPDSGEFQGNQTATTYDPGSMANSTTYYWRIDEVNAEGTTTGNVWSFTTEAAPTPPGQANNPSPANSATDVSVAADLSWTAGSGATSHDVYFGTTSPGTFQGNQAATTFDAGTMDYDTTYYWRIDEINAAGTTTGTVWSFTTTATAPTSECENWQTLHPEWIFCDDFETEQDLSVNYNDRSENGMSVTTNDPFDGTYSLEQAYTIGQVDAGWITKFIGDNPHLGSPGAKLDEVYFRFYHKFEDGFTGFPPKTAQCKIFRTFDDWSGGLAVYQWLNASGPLTADIRTYDGSDYIWIGATNSTLDYSNPANIGRWICIEVRIKSNTAGQSDGEVQYWIDGALGLDLTGQNLRAEYNNGKGLNMVMWNCYWNAGSPAVQSRFYDNLVISTAPIGQWTPGPQPPEQASNPSPADSATDVSTTADLSWTAGTGSTSSDVYFGTTSPGTFQGNLTETTFDAGTMANNTTYYWRIDEINAQGTTTGNVWSFKTIVGAPAQASNPTPADSAANVSITEDLSWTAGSGATSHDVYFGTSSPGAFQGNQAATTFDTGAMANDTTYYWRIDEVNAGGTTTGTVWNFTTIVGAPVQASNPGPANSAADVAVNADLSWTAGSGATSHDVYFGTSSPGSYQGNQAATTFDTGAMANDTTYYWRIDEVNAGGTTTGSVWNFTTIVAAPSQATNPSPGNSATDVAVDADLSWTAGSGTTSHDVYFGTSSPGAFQGNQAATTFDTGTMTNDTTYYWRIDEVNAGGTTPGSVWSFTTIVAAPSQATSPSPADSAADISINTDLSWTAGSGAATHDVYFGTSSPGSYQGNQAATTFDPGAMDYDTTYYWRIDEVNAGGTTTGSVWSFTTGLQPSVDPNLVGWWELENNANDSIGTNDGTIYGAVGTSGKFGQALSFDEVDDYVDIPDFDYTNTSNEFSLSFWFRIADVAGSLYQYMYSHGNYGAANSLNVYFSETDEGTGGEEVRTNITLSDSNSWQPSTASIFADGQWHMYTITVSSVDGATIYIDANSVLTNPAIKGAALNPATAIHIGSRCDYNVDRYYGNPSIDDGLLDDVRLYNRVLNQTDVNDIYAGGPAPPSQATNPAPADTATDVSIEADLSWTAGSGATSHDVYLGTTSPGDFQGNQAETTFEPGTLSYDITYYWRIDEINAAGTTTGAVWSFTTEAAPQPPGQASNPDPADSVTNVSINADLSWTAGSGSTSSDVYFGTTSPGAFQGNQAETTFDPGTMANDTTYYWRIDEINAVGTTTGVVWSFTTIVAPPSQASNPDPADSATNVDIDADLSWTAGTGSTSSDVYFGTTSPGSFQGNQTETTFDPGTMANDTTYYWRIDEINVAGTTTGAVWNFTTIVAPPVQATNPDPADSAVDISKTADLSWTAGSGATSHDVYFGTTSPGSFQGNQTATTFDPGTMANDTTYYWRIDEINAGGTTTGTVWSFTTVAGTGNQIIGWWQLDDASSSTATDSSAYGNDGTLVGNVAWTDDAEQGWCLDFPGNPTDYVTIPNESDYDLTGNMTVMAWMKAGYIDWRNFSTIIAKGQDPTGWALQKAGRDNAMGFYVGVSGMPWDGIKAGVGIFDGQWHHVAGVYDGSNAYIYIDGGLDSNSVACSGSIATNDYDVYMGLNSQSMGRSWEGLVDDVRVYNYALTQSEINDIYTGGPTPPGQASSPSPADSATDISVDADLSWTAGSGATSRDIYFGTSSPGTFQGNQTASTFDPGTMAYDTTYYWRIDEINAAGTTTGVVWSFTTEQELLPPGQATNPSPTDSATDIDIDADLSWTAGSGSTSSDVYFGTISPGAFQGNQTATTFEPGTMANDTTCYWRIDEINAVGTKTGVVWSFTTESAGLLPWTDGFESGDLVTGGWNISGDATAAERSAYTGSYGAEVAATSWMEKAISTTGFTSIHVKYVRKTKGLDNGEYLYVEWYDGGGWNPLESTQDTSWDSKDIICPSRADNNADFKVRFRTNADKGNEYGAIDDVEINGTSQ